MVDAVDAGTQELTRNMAERCRICLVNHGCMTSMQEEHVESKLKDLTKCTCIDIKYEENLPSVVCHVCLYKLNMWSKFKERFIQLNKMLLEQLVVSETSDNNIKELSRDETHPPESTKRKCTSKCADMDNAFGHQKKKSKLNVSLSDMINVDKCDTSYVVLDTICISDDENDPASSKDPSCTLNVPDNGNLKNAENGSADHTDGKVSSSPTRARLLPVRRGRNIERRKASTKRWVERKKALLAATGEHVSDTDSVVSDDAQLSPVQKARAKTNADKEVERQKRIAKVLKNLETNLTEKYTVIPEIDTDSDARKTRLSKDSSALRQSNKNPLKPEEEKKNGVDRDRSLSLDSSMEKENSPMSLRGNNMLKDAKKSTSKIVDDAFVPQSLKSELVIGDTTYIVTSTLILADSPYFSKEMLNNLTKDPKSFNLDENGQEKNTDIIDAVQLRRIHPVVSNVKNKKFIERCLNIDVEGNELAVLKRVQVELADFVEKEMKQKLFGTNDGTGKGDGRIDSADSFQKLDQKLKSIIERAIKKNIEATILRDAADAACSQASANDSQTTPAKSPTSPMYQPKVMVKRLDIAKESKQYNINNAHALKKAMPKSKLAGPFSAMSRKRQSVLPIRYNDYNTSALESDPDSDDFIVRAAPKVANPRTYATAKQLLAGNSQASTVKKTESAGLAVKSQDNNVASTALTVVQNTEKEQKTGYENSIKIEGAIAENHICGVCGLSFNSRKDVETHVRIHKVAVLQSESTVTPRSSKQKMMRCKRCHEIVEARYVKAHVCKTATEVHKCFVCNCTFRTEKLLARHLNSHDQSEFNVTNAIGNKRQASNVVGPVQQKLITSTMPQADQNKKTEAAAKSQNAFAGRNDIQSGKLVGPAAQRPKETYTCFVCDKIFTDEEVLKDHLQKHCDDLSEGEQSTSKEQYQCAICGDTLESDQALEEHVGKHLFDDEDDNPNLISINRDEDKAKEAKETYHCGQCSEMFDSEMLLEIHMQAHEEDVAIAEWEKQTMKVYQYQCMLCDELLDTEEELTEHLDVHNGNAQVCQLCDKPFRTLEDLQQHVATH